MSALMRFPSVIIPVAILSSTTEETSFGFTITLPCCPITFLSKIGCLFSTSINNLALGFDNKNLLCQL